MPNSGVEFNPEPFEAHIRALAGERIDAAKLRIREKMRELTEQIVADSPKWTGASAGEATGREIPRSHPAYGMRIGNFLNGGDTGWQYSERQEGANYVFALSNPMWEPYLKYVEYGFSNSKQSFFVTQAWINFLRQF